MQKEKAVKSCGGCRDCDIMQKGNFAGQMSGQYAAVSASVQSGSSDLEYLVWTLELPEKFIKFLPVVLRHCKLAVLTRLDVLDHCQHTAFN